MMNENAMVTPFFKTVAIPDPVASKLEGRPIFKEMEVVEVRIAGDMRFQPVFPAHAMFDRFEGQEITYAQRWPEAYARFKATKEQIAAGTPLSELPFLNEAERASLRLAKVYTAEALAGLDGKNLNALGPKAREMKRQAEAYLERARSGAATAEMAAEVAALRAELERLRGGVAEETPNDVTEADDIEKAENLIIEKAEDVEKAELKAYIEEVTGARPRGNPSLETLRESVAQLRAA